MRHFAALALLVLAAAPTVTWAQNAPRPATPQPAPAQNIPLTTALPAATLPVPDALEMSKLIWTTMAAVDAANLSGNYSVLRDLSAPSFQINNDPARLAQIFAGLRASRIDLSNALLLAPTYAQAPRLLPENIIQVQGFFGLRPTAIQFDLQFQWVQGRWRLLGVSINPATIMSTQPGPPTPPVQQQPKR